MKRIAIVIFALTLVSCLKDEVIEINRVNDIIKYGVVTNASTRAADIYCNNNLPASFHVWAKYDGLTYIEDMDVVRDGSSWSSEKDVYWPAGKVAFYAHVNAGDKFRWSLSGSPVIEDYTVDTDPSKQLDLLYAVKTQEKGNGTVLLNFRHALSQIVFQAKNTNPGLHIIVKGVKVCNLGNKGTFTYPNGNTDDTIINHDGNGETTTNGDIGNWNSIIGGETDYSISFNEGIPVEYTSDGSPVSLTSTIDKPSESTLKEFNGNAMLLLPQKTTAWIPEAGKGNPNASTQTGTYFLIDCAIYQNAKDVDGNDVRVYLWGSQSATKEVAIPADINWSQGNKYVYTFIFGDGNGGYNPDSKDPEEVLFPIEFDVDVDDFIPGTGEDVTMEEVVPEVLPDLKFVSRLLTAEENATLASGGTVTINGEDFDENSHVMVQGGNTWPDTDKDIADDDVPTGTVKITGFTSGAISLKLADMNIEITDNKLESMDFGGNNIKLSITNNIIDAKKRSHWRYDSDENKDGNPDIAMDAGNNTKHGVRLYSAKYDLTFENNTIINTLGASFRINGWGYNINWTTNPPYSHGERMSLNLNKISSFKNNNLQACVDGGCVVHIVGDCSHYAYKDSPTEDRKNYTYASPDYTPQYITQAAQDFMAMAEAAENNNKFTKASGVTTAYKYKICNLFNTVTWAGIYYEQF